MKTRKMIKKRAQEEMVGFALIIMLVMVIALVFLGISMRKNSERVVESFEVDSFIQAIKQYTTDCDIGLSERTINQLVLDCENRKKCDDNRDVCDVLELELRNLMKKSWDVQEGSPVKGYLLLIKSGNENLIEIKEGNETRNYNGPTQGFADELGIEVRVYE